MIEGQANMVLQLQEILDKISYKESDKLNVTKTFYETLHGYPLKTLDEFREMESDSKKKQAQKGGEYFYESIT